MHTEKKNQEIVGKSSRKELWKFLLNKTNFDRIFLVKYIYICTKFFIYEILSWQLKVVSTIFTFIIKIKFVKNYQKYFLFYLKAPFFLDTSLVSSFFPFLAIPVFIEEVDW